MTASKLLLVLIAFLFSCGKDDKGAEVSCADCSRVVAMEDSIADYKEARALLQRIEINQKFSELDKATKRVFTMYGKFTDSGLDYWEVEPYFLQLNGREPIGDPLVEEGFEEGYCHLLFGMLFVVAEDQISNITDGYHCAERKIPIDDVSYLNRAFEWAKAHQ